MDNYIRVKDEDQKAAADQFAYFPLITECVIALGKVNNEVVLGHVPPDVKHELPHDHFIDDKELAKGVKNLNLGGELGVDGCQ
ncbi:Protein of unknown function [Cotesia congregata]|uniref:Uncharacterized protein n=1 Tax=Cotesia congregata TaxID=51543 RepID=A0A8J2E442_COTCN|nr:Protein of unknown function [Cotesia congregata]